MSCCAMNWSNRPEQRDKWQCFGLMSDSVSVSLHRAAGAGELWRRQSEPNASGGIKVFFCCCCCFLFFFM